MTFSCSDGQTTWPLALPTLQSAQHWGTKKNGPKFKGLAISAAFCCLAAGAPPPVSLVVVHHLTPHLPGEREPQSVKNRWFLCTLKHKMLCLKPGLILGHCFSHLFIVMFLKVPCAKDHFLEWIMCMFVKTWIWGLYQIPIEVHGMGSSNLNFLITQVILMDTQFWESVP